MLLLRILTRWENKALFGNKWLFCFPHLVFVFIMIFQLLVTRIWLLLRTDKIGSIISNANPIPAQDINRRQMCSAEDPSDELSFGADRVIARLSRCVFVRRLLNLRLSQMKIYTNESANESPWRGKMFLSHKVLLWVWFSVSGPTDHDCAAAVLALGHRASEGGIRQPRPFAAREFYGTKT